MFNRFACLFVVFCSSGLATAAPPGKPATAFIIANRPYSTPAQACQAELEERNADTYVMRKYTRVAVARDDGEEGGLYCDLRDKENVENAQHYGEKVVVEVGADSLAPMAPKNSAQDAPNNCADLEALGKPQLFFELEARVRNLMNAANEELIRNPAVAMTVLKREAVANTFGDAGHDAAGNMSNRVFPVVYGNAVERLTAAAVAADVCLPRYLQHVENQSVEGVNPDFKGINKAAGLQIDITTPESAVSKQADKRRAGYRYLTYRRGLVINQQGRAVPIP